MKSVIESRQALGLNQADFGALLGAHPMTVSRWERGISTPTPWQCALIEEIEFRASCMETPRGAGLFISEWIAHSGGVSAMCMVVSQGR